MDSGYSEVSPEELLDYHGIEYRETSGSRGRQFNIKTCPVCGGNKWKVYLNVDNGYGNCFHGDCEAKFNLWTFGKAVLDTQDNVAVGRMFDEIAKQSGWKPKPRSVPVVPAVEGKLKLPHSLEIPDENIKYLEDRGVTASTAQLFGLRNCIQGAFRYKNESGEDKLVPFSGRLIIPIRNLSGELATFQGRDMTDTSDRKYLFPPRLPGTARFLYNGDMAFQRKSKHIIMGEGAFDAIAIHQAIDSEVEFLGYTAVGSFGKKLTLDPDPDNKTQLEALIELKNVGLETVTIMWDGEQSALESAIKACQKLEGYGFETYIALLPKGKDPAEVEPKTIRASIRNRLRYSKKMSLKIRFAKPYS